MKLIACEVNNYVVCSFYNLGGADGWVKNVSYTGNLENYSTKFDQLPN